MTSLKLHPNLPGGNELKYTKIHNDFYLSSHDDTDISVGIRIGQDPPDFLMVSVFELLLVIILKHQFKNS